MAAADTLWLISGVCIMSVFFPYYTRMKPDPGFLLFWMIFFSLSAGLFALLAVIVSKLDEKQ